MSFNTFSTKNVYKNCEVFVDPILDQHSGANHQNLFDNTMVHINAQSTEEYPLFAGGGAGYWKPSHGAYSTFWNTQVILENKKIDGASFLLNGMSDGPHARVIGISGNSIFNVQYGPSAYIDSVNMELSHIPSLYDYQLSKRINK